MSRSLSSAFTWLMIFVQLGLVVQGCTAEAYAPSEEDELLSQVVPSEASAGAEKSIAAVISDQAAINFLRRTYGLGEENPRVRLASPIQISENGTRVSAVELALANNQTLKLSSFTPAANGRFIKARARLANASPNVQQSTYTGGIEVLRRKLRPVPSIKTVDIKQE